MSVTTTVFHPLSSAYRTFTLLAPRNLLLIGISLLLSLPVLTVIFSWFFPSTDTWRHLYTTVLDEYLINSLLLMLGVGMLSSLLGIIPAWLVTMCEFPGKRTLEWSLLLPLAIPAYIIAYTYAGILDATGPVQTFLREVTGWEFREYWFPEIRSLGGAIFMLSFVLYPYIYLISRAAFIEQSICALEVARTLGCGPYKTFFRVALPLARPAIIVGLSLVLMETLADYGTVQYYGIATFTTGIFRTWFGLGDSIAASQLSSLLLLFIAILIYMEYWSRKQQRFHHTSTRYSTLVPARLNGWLAWLALLGCSVPVIVGFLIPVWFLFRWAMLTYADVLTPEFFRLIWNSFMLALSAAVLATMVALVLAYGKRRQPDTVNRLSVNICSLGYAIPGTVIAVGVMLPFAWLDTTLDTFFRSYLQFSTGLLFSGTLLAVMFAYLVRFLAVSIRTIEAGLVKIKPSMDEVSRSFGISGARLIHRVHVPMMRGSFLAALLLVFVDVLKELPATLILRPFDFNTLAIRAYELANEERLADAACPSLAIVLVGILPVIFLSRTISSSRPGYEQRP